MGVRLVLPTSTSATGSVRVDVDAGGGRAGLRVVGRRGQLLHRDVLVDGTGATEPDAGATGDATRDAGDRLLAAADEALVAAGWLRAGGWRLLPAGAAPGDAAPDDAAPGPVPGPAWTAGTTALPRTPLDAAGLRALDTLGYLTRVARGPVTVGALVPHAAPSRRLAGVLVRRLVAAGHARAVGRTAGSRPQALYAPVGSPWAPARDDA